MAGGLQMVFDKKTTLNKYIYEANQPYNQNINLKKLYLKKFCTMY